ncbi:MAG TPA: hypothetical protein P5567_03045 [Kiritimatiellia bacterium]|nr:hypothetical protein [Kiritimatiellia bacterium]HSA17039.1 hypothetical protein [Kiritimatiellia bacterium]
MTTHQHKEPRFLDNRLKTAEREWIRTRREQVNADPSGARHRIPYAHPETPGQDVGLALSGGGIRSATFNLGLLQALQRYGHFWKIDFLSTVSGGGYIGSCLTWFMSCLGMEFPLGARRSDNAEFPGAVHNWLRDHGQYITPGRGMGAFAVAAAVLTGLLVNLAILLPPALLLIQALRVPIGSRPASIWIGIGGAILLSLLVAGMFAQALLSGLTRSSPWFQRLECQCEKWKGRLLLFGLCGLLVSIVPWIHDLLSCKGAAWIRSIKIPAGLSAGGVCSILVALIGGKSKSSALSPGRSFFLCAGLSLLIYALAITLFSWAGRVFQPAMPFWIFPAVFTAALLLGLLADINRMSLHRFYRNRLRDAYLPRPRLLVPEPERAQYPDADPENSLLKDIQPTRAPYHIINAAQNTVGSKRYKLRERGADNFIFTAKYCGSESAGYASTSEYGLGRTNLATAMAVSGAAVDPHTYATRSRALSFIMSFLNIRLGYWIHRPGHPPPRWNTFWRPLWYRCMGYEMTGKGLSEDSVYLHLSDGGQFENLGLYELIRRQCRCIIVSDATADAERGFSDLGRAMELVRADFGTRIDINTAPLRIPKALGFYPACHVIGRIRYADESTGALIYIKPTLMKDTPEDVLAYHRKHPQFPAESTGDQFFSEQQFEAYRELGFQTGRQLADVLEEELDL